MEKHRIISVTIVEGNTLNANWKSNMQKIVTDKGNYIDNLKGRQFGCQEDGAKPGYDWASHVGEVVQNIRTFSSRGYLWLNKQ